MRNSFVAELSALAEMHSKIWLLCGDLGYSVLESFQRRFPKRFLNVGVAEQNMAGLAAGIALSGKTVFIYSIGNFPTLRCLEQLRNDVCYHGADVKVVAVGAGFAYGSQGYTHHAIEDVAVMSCLPGMEVFVPCDPTEVRLATRYMATSGKPAYLRLSRTGEPDLHSVEPKDAKQAVVLRQGVDVVILSCGPVVASCLAAAGLLARDNIEATVASLPCLKPIDEPFLDGVSRAAKLIVTVEEHILRGGLYATVASYLAAKSWRPPVVGIGIPELAGKVSLGGDRDALLAAAGLSPESIAHRIRENVMSGSAQPVA